MYNFDLKNKFITEEVKSKSTKQAYEFIFKGFEKYETEWGSDLCTRHAFELSKVIESIIGVRMSAINAQLSLIKRYIKWCVKTNYPGAIDETDFIIIGLDKIASKIIASPKSLQEYLDSVFDPENPVTVDVTMRAALWMAFSGIEEDDIINIQCNNVDLKESVIIYKSKKYPIYKEGLNSIANCVNLKEFVYRHPRYEDTSRYRFEGNQLIRGFSEMTVSKFRASYGRKVKHAIENKKTNMQLSYSRIWMSGIFYRAYENEKLGYDVDFGFRIEDKYTFTTDDERERARRISKVEKFYNKDYETWKKVLIVKNYE